MNVSLFLNESTFGIKTTVTGSGVWIGIVLRKMSVCIHCILTKSWIAVMNISVNHWHSMLITRYICMVVDNPTHEVSLSFSILS